jgi:threonyl-tRNA synthetase
MMVPPTTSSTTCSPQACAPDWRSLGSRIHTSRQRRDCLIAVLGQAEIDAHQVHVTDIAAGSTSPVARDRLIQTLQHSHRKRTATPNWAIPD